MGTSKSYDGPGSPPPLLPNLPANPVPPPEPPDAAPPPDEVLPADAVPTPVQVDTTAPPPIPPLVVQTKSNWTSSKRALGVAVSGRGSASAATWARASRRYVTALGGSKKAASSSASGRNATRALGSFLSTAAAANLGAALNELGLNGLVGRGIEEVVAGLCDVFAPAAQTREDSIARRAIAETLLDLLLPHTNERKELQTVDRLSEPQVHAALLAAITTYIFRRWVSDFGKHIEKKAISEAQAVRREAEMRRCIKMRVRLTFRNKNVLRIDWKGEEGKTYVNELYQHAYETLSR